MALRPPLDGSRERIWDNFLENAETVTPPYTPNNKQVLLVDSAGTITLPSAGTATLGYYIKNISTGAVTVEPQAGETIDGASSYSLSNQYDVIHIISDGLNWYLL